MTLEQVADLNNLPPPTPERIKKSRELVKLSQRQAAASIGQTKRSWQHYEWGKRTMSAARFMKFLVATSHLREKKHTTQDLASLELKAVLNSPEHKAWVESRRAQSNAFFAVASPPIDD